MTPSANQPNAHSQAHSQAELDALLHQLRRKQGSWVEWGQACRTLQKAGMSPQQIFEGTGFEPIQQNQIIVATQVYESMLAAGVSDSAQAHFTERGSDSLYELRILSQTDRARAAELIAQHGLESDQVKEIARALQEFSYSAEPPSGFTSDSGDAVAFHYWRLARQQSDLQARSRLIAQGLRFANSDSARQKIEQLLTDFTVIQSQTAPKLPLFRLESEADSPCIIPVVGQLPIAIADYKAVPITEPEPPFGLVKFSGMGAWVPVPGWQVILKAEDPVALLAPFEQLPNVPSNASAEQVLVIIDRASRDWDVYSYFIADAAGQLKIQWFEQPPAAALLGRVVLVMRPQKILDEGYTKELWQVDE
ncbi:hypothetical protein IQ241_12980 [Romeria aff. gracilis LEGE 07310]|uniref:RuBisCO accumulation factor 1 n=1 Tax=Vasconcelosia minhoensis LEGE 07310 TaxID=915328 RepID=A0A8J7AFZ0_9CYAN|nr:RuBisCO accumulation factor 1 [Romeria gracilis]MBE9078194.1 hypothetical protein [Romeria aff. gracilis LEGE 07310]